MDGCTHASTHACQQRNIVCVDGGWCGGGGWGRGREVSSRASPVGVVRSLLQAKKLIRHRGESELTTN